MSTWVPPKISNISLRYIKAGVSVCKGWGCHGSSHFLRTDWRTHHREWFKIWAFPCIWLVLFLRHFLKSRLEVFFRMQCVYLGFRCFRNYGTVVSLCQCEVLDVHLQKRVCQAFVKQLEARCAGSVQHCERVVLIFSDALAACACFCISRIRA